MTPAMFCFLKWKKPRRLLDRAYICGMEFTDYLIWKALVVVVLAAAYSFWKGFTGR